MKVKHSRIFSCREDILRKKVVALNLAITNYYLDSSESESDGILTIFLKKVNLRFDSLTIFHVNQLVDMLEFCQLHLMLSRHFVKKMELWQAAIVFMKTQGY